MTDNKAEEIDIIGQEIIKLIKEEKDLNLKIKLTALNNYNNQKIKLDEQQEKELNQIKQKYEALERPLLEKQNQIIQGLKNIEKEEVQNIEDFLQKEQIVDEIFQDQTCIKEYWMKCLQNQEAINEQIKDNDIKILKHLIKITVNKKINEESKKEEKVELEFEFSENQFFKNKLLKKTFFLDQRDGSANRSEGCEIEWNEGKDITKSQKKKKQKNKKTGAVKEVIKTVLNQSFFNLFNNVDVREEVINQLEEEELEEVMERMDIDWTIAENLMEEIIPYSLEYYLNVVKMDHSDQHEEQHKHKGKNCC